MKRSLKISLVTALAALALGTGTAVADDTYSTYNSGPPSARYVQAQPRDGHVWVQGRYAWQYNRWVWIPGYYEPVRTGYTWVDGNWDHRDGNWHWREGRWDRGASYDHGQSTYQRTHQSYDRGHDRSRDFRSPGQSRDHRTVRSHDDGRRSPGRGRRGGH